MIRSHSIHHLKNKQGSIHKKKQEYPLSLYILFMLFVLYMTLPIIDVPLLSLSASAPIFFFITLQVFFRSSGVWIRGYFKWVLLVVLIWIGIFVSAIANGFTSGGTHIDTGTWVALAQYAYWFLTFVVSVYLMSTQARLAERVALGVAVGVMVLGILRLGEAVFGGAIGAWMNLSVMTQNSYGIQFSMFFPVLLSFTYTKEKQRFAIAGALILLLAMLINGSRSNWIASVISTFVFVVLLVLAQRKASRILIVFLALAMLVGFSTLFIPKIVVNTFEQRFSTLGRLEQDKSYAIRQLMVQKGIGLYKSSPWVGVGISRWRKESVPLVVPKILGYYPQSYYDVKSSHNSYVSHLAESGLVGTIPLGIFLLILIVYGYRYAIVLGKEGQIWAIGFYAGFIGMSIHLWALSGLTGTVTWFVYALVAVVIVLGRDQARKEKKKRASRFSLPHTRSRAR